MDGWDGNRSWLSRPLPNACGTQYKYWVTDSLTQLPIVNEIEQAVLSYNEARRKRKKRVWKKARLYGRRQQEMCSERGTPQYILVKELEWAGGKHQRRKYDKAKQ